MKICRKNFFSASLFLFVLFGVRSGEDDQLPPTQLSSQLVREWSLDERIERVKELAVLRDISIPLHPDCVCEIRPIRRELEHCIGIEAADVICCPLDAFECTLKTLDLVAAEQYVDDDQRNLFLYTALCHDLGKCDGTDGTTQTVQLLERLGLHEQLRVRVCEMVRYCSEPDRIARDEMGRFEVLAHNKSEPLTDVRREFKEETIAMCCSLAKRLLHGITISSLLRFAQLSFSGHCPPVMNHGGSSKSEVLCFFEMRAREAGVLVADC